MHFSTHRKIQFPEDENTSFHFEERQTSTKASTGFSTDSTYKQQVRKLHHWKSAEGCMFPSDRHEILRGKSFGTPSYNFTRRRNVEGSWHREQCNKLGYGHLEIYNKTSRILSRKKHHKFDANKRASDASFGKFGDKDIGPRRERYSALGKRIRYIFKENQLAKSLACEDPTKFSLQSPGPNHVCNSECDQNIACNVSGTKSQHNLLLKSNFSSICCSVNNDEFYQQKKPRLGWGEGLAKYENHNVDGADDNSGKSGFKISHAVGPNVEIRSQETILSNSECILPGSLFPSANITSPEDHVPSHCIRSCESILYEKVCNEISSTCIRGDYFENSSILGSTLPLFLSWITNGESSLDSDHVDSKPLAQTKSKTVETLHMGVQSERLLALKNEILQRLERIDYDFDRLEKELGCINSEIQAKDCHSDRKDSFHISGDCLHEMFRVDEKTMVVRLAGGAQMCSEVHLIKDRVEPLLDREATEVVTVNECFKLQKIECQIMGTENSMAATQCFGSQSTEQQDPVSFKNIAANREDGSVEGRSEIAKGPSLSSCIKDYPRFTIQSTLKANCSLFNSLVTSSELIEVAPESSLKLLATVSAGDSGLLCSEISEASAWKQNAEMHERNRKQLEEKIVEQRQFLNFKEQLLARKFKILRKWQKEGRLLLSARKGCEECYQNDGSFSCRNQCCQPSYDGQSSLSDALVLIPTSEDGQLGLDVHASRYRSVLKMPAMTLHDKERHFSKFLTSNGLVEDPIAIERERKDFNPWTTKEKEIFWEKIALFNKNFGEVASFLEHKTVADCVEFYYKNHKSEEFQKLKKRHNLNQGKRDSSTRAYLVISGTKRPCLSYATSLDVLGAVVALRMDGTDQKKRDQGTLQQCPKARKIGTCLVPEKMNGKFNYEATVDTDFVESDWKCTVSADVLPGTCAAVSSEVTGSCISSAVDLYDGFYKKPCSWASSMKKQNGMDQPLTPETELKACDSVEEYCESTNTDWTDNEKWLFINAVSKYGKDFGRISYHVHSRTEDQCRTFFCKARKSLKLDDVVCHQPIALNQQPITQVQ